MSDQSKHLSYFKVENFKRFKSLELKDIGQFNIIVGDNNTGKTSLLEALLVEEYHKPGEETIQFTFSSLAKRYKQRKNITEAYNMPWQELYDYFLNNNSVPLLTKQQQLDSRLDKTLITFYTQPLSTHLRPEITELIIPRNTIPFIGFGNFYDSTFEKKYAKHIQTSVSQKNKFTQRLMAFINKISYLDMSLDENRDMKLLIAESYKDATTEIGKFGEGSLKLARILVDTIVYAGERLMIDEVEAGVHWSRFQIFWKTILLSAIENNTQLFMTTHDVECLQYLIHAVDETPELASVKDKFRLLELRERTTDNDIAPIIHNYEALHYFLENGREVRGGHIVK